jgi:hypothetical protein
MNENTNIFRKESLERLASPEQLDQLMQVVSPKSWLPLAALGSLVTVALLWSIFGRIPVTATGEGILVRPTDASSELVGLTYFKREEGDRIQPGMEVMLIPNSTRAQRLGGIMGRVEAVSQPSVTTLDAARQAEGTLSLQDGSVEVIATLERDPSSPNGFKCSSPQGGELEIFPGITTTVRITLEERAPITFVFPFLDRVPT